MSKKIKIDFFHDVICSWCFVISPRLKELVKEYPEIEVIHHSFALLRNENDPIKMFGSIDNLKKEVMKHWREANRRDNACRIDADLMESRDFKYPLSINGLRGCKAAENQGGQDAHWLYFDLVQRSLLSEAKNIEDRELLIELAKEAGLDIYQFIMDFDSDKILKSIEEDIELAKEWGVYSVPTIMINETRKVSGVIEYSDLKKLIEAEIG